MTEKNMSRHLPAHQNTARRRGLGVTNHKARIRVGVDARSIFMPRPRGTGRNLRDAYQLIPSLRPDWNFTLYHQRNLAGEAWRARPNVRTRRIDMPGDRFDLWFQLRLPAAAWRDGVDLLHLPANAAPRRSPVPLIVTVHDLVPLADAGDCSAAQRRAFRRGIQRAVRGATHIISPSNATRDELCATFGVDAARVTVIPWAPDRDITEVAGEAVDSQSKPTSAELQRRIERVRADYGLDGDWLINFSGSSSRKNARGLLDACAALPPAVRAAVQFVLVGCEPASFRAELEARARQLGIRGKCRLLGFVPHEDLPGLLGGARGLVMPSLCEGFGLPILDAFACGTPVLTSNLSSMPDIAGDAAVYCDPRSQTSIAEGIVRLLEPTCSQRLRKAGYQRLREFSWERTARLMCEVYERCLSPGKQSIVRTRPAAVAPTETCGV